MLFLVCPHRLVRRNTVIIGLVPVLCLGMLSCGYRFWTGKLAPAGEEMQESGMRVSDDGTVTFIKERLELAVRPLTVAELNRQFPHHSRSGTESTNPYTYGDWKDPRTGEGPDRFLVFSLKVKNYSHPKIRVDPSNARVTTDVGMTYRPLGKLDLERYFRTYVTGYAGVPYLRFEERKDTARATLFQGDVVFSGQEAEGYLVFPTLHHEVKAVVLNLNEVVLSFDYANEPVETIDVKYRFQRETGRLYTDGRLVKSRPGH